MDNFAPQAIFFKGKNGISKGKMGDNFAPQAKNFEVKMGFLKGKCGQFCAAGEIFLRIFSQNPSKFLSDPPLIFMDLGQEGGVS